MNAYQAFAPHRSVREYLGTPGNELGGLILPAWVLDSHAQSVTAGTPEEYIVMGEWERDGKTYLCFGVTREYIEAVSDFRDRNGQMVYVCPDCEGASGKHSRSCKR
jgi:hypothetical protein